MAGTELAASISDSWFLHRHNGNNPAGYCEDRTMKRKQARLVFFTLFPAFVLRLDKWLPLSRGHQSSINSLHGLCILTSSRSETLCSDSETLRSGFSSVYLTVCALTGDEAITRPINQRCRDSLVTLRPWHHRLSVLQMRTHLTALLNRLVSNHNNFDGGSFLFQQGSYQQLIFLCCMTPSLWTIN